MIRRANADDLHTVVSLTREAYAQYEALLGGHPIPVTEDYAPRIADRQVWLLEIDGWDVGLIVLEPQEDHLLIFSIAVAPAHQGKGHGIRLLEWSESRAREIGLQELRLYTNAKMERNIALYTRFGYRETGRRDNPARPGFIAVDMVKRLDGAGA